MSEVQTPAKRNASHWLDVAKLRDDLRVLGKLAHDLKVGLQAKQREACSNALAYRSLEHFTNERSDAYLKFIDSAVEVGKDAIRLARLKQKITDLCVLRAMHRGKRHSLRRRVFRRGLPNGSAVVEGPPEISEALLERYRLSS